MFRNYNREVLVSEIQILQKRVFDGNYVDTSFTPMLVMWQEGNCHEIGGGVAV